MTAHPSFGPLIMGASGRLGRALAQAWPCHVPQPIWQTRDGAGGTLKWDILNSPPPDIIGVNGVVMLAGVTQGSPKDFALNTPLAQAGVNLGQRLGVPVLIASTQAVYGPQQGLLREETTLMPTTDYGRAKMAMELAVAAPHVTCLRIGNVVGCDALADSIANGSVVLDRFVDGQGPRRAMLGPLDLAHVLCTLLVASVRPPVLNVARPGLVAMADILAAAGKSFDWRRADHRALATLALDVSLLQSICPMPPANAVDMVAQLESA